MDAHRTWDSLKSTASPLSLRDDDGCDPPAPPPLPPPMLRRFFDTPSTCAHGHPTPTGNTGAKFQSAPHLPEKEKHNWQSHRARRARATDKVVRHKVPRRSAGARAGPAAAGAARARRRRGRGGGRTSRRPRPWTRLWRGRGGAPGRPRARRRTPLLHIVPLLHRIHGLVQVP